MPTSDFLEVPVTPTNSLRKRVRAFVATNSQRIKGGTRMNHRLSTIVLGFLILVTSMVSGVAYAAPTFEWTPKSLTQTIGLGESKTITVTFTASQNTSNAVARVARNLQPYIKIIHGFLGRSSRVLRQPSMLPSHRPHTLFWGHTRELS